MKLKKGEIIIHPRQGACRIKKVLPKRIVLCPCFNKGSRLTIFIPKKNIEKIGLRSLKTKKEVLRALKNLNARVKVQKLEYSREELREWFEKGDLESLSRATLELYKNIYVDEDNRISQKKLLERTINFLAEEVAAVQRMSKKEARKKILDRLRRTFGC